MKIIRVFKYFLITVLVSLSFSAYTQGLSADTIQLLDQLVISNKTTAPGGVVTVTRYGKEIYNKAYGYADLEHAIENTTTTVFEAGSVSKQFTATMVLMLAAEGRLSLEDDVRKYIPELPDYGTVITIRNLLTHSSGIKDWGSVAAIGGWPRGTRVYTQNLSRDIIFRQRSLNFKPGTEYSYSNSGYALSVALIERITKKTLAQVSKEKIFDPVGMTNTQWRDDFRKVVKYRAIAYGKSGDDYLQDMPFEHTHGHGGLLTTTADLLKWNQYWAEGRFGEKLAKMRLEQGVLADGLQTDYAAGAVRVATVNGHKEISHSGATAGYRAWLAYYPEKDISVAILSNDATSSVVPLGKKVIQVFVGKEPAARQDLTVTGGQLKAKAGFYRSVTGADMVELLANDTKLSTRTGTDYIPTAPGTFIAGGQKLIFSDDNSLGIQTSNGTRLYKKVASWVPSAKQMEEYTGVFTSTEADAVLTIKLNDGKLTAWREGKVALPLTPAYTDAFTTRSGVLVEFFRDKKKKVAGFSINSDRAENIQFHKTKAL